MLPKWSKWSWIITSPLTTLGTHRLPRICETFTPAPFLLFFGPLEPLAVAKEVLCSTSFSVLLPESHLRSATSSHHVNWGGLGIPSARWFCPLFICIYVFIILNHLPICHGLELSSSTRSCLLNRGRGSRIKGHYSCAMIHLSKVWEPQFESLLVLCLSHKWPLFFFWAV